MFPLLSRNNEFVIKIISEIFNFYGSECEQVLRGAKDAQIADWYKRQVEKKVFGVELPEGKILVLPPTWSGSKKSGVFELARASS